MDAEQKLAQYRARKRRQEYLESVTGSLRSFFTSKVTGRNTVMTGTVNEPLVIDGVSDEELEEDENCSWSYLQIVTYILYFILWGTVYLIFIKLQFGIIYLIISALIGIYLNTRTSPKKRNEVSAYSVFNENCKSIDGTLKAEQFEKEIRFGAIGVH
ncbi:hypothetical protein PPYR_07672 [Photinus pyralis]|uniref:SAYSvFN domain-containing protein n=1 Tax=Photinus pyralis TaxID=7054 RepID=A0A1Y1KXB0_PHOPY|nr:SAYSvFN domain-containing protein 1 [Photinus pyralis]KAB0799792.1 hypothetical protein PPYR_07672 [Photinus pyralis]